MFHSKSSEQTFFLGEALGKLLFPGSLVYLTGELGAGKTNFAQGLIKGLGVDEPVASPTYTIINEYQGRYPVYHFDVYRLNHWSELEDLGYEEYFYGQGVVVIEWADLIEEILPKEGIWIRIEFVEEGRAEERRIEVEPKGELYEKIVEEWKKKCMF
ncbi:MAG TPA: tRNA (adenosine(37)-N6)-threonylcarbamoyltransferase complex ATPase subunit type 1 TsaE [Clostridia bacterium]|nr:tRNA (adenosine(37)-N6)-threonylcarbamoyltransferase complex ATPase subunit type 1 TsaE [Clostridia bacterium]